MTFCGALTSRRGKGRAAGPAGLVHDKLAGMTVMTYGGTLTVTATGDPLALGDTFALFSAGGSAGPGKAKAVDIIPK